jgi:alkyl hydroperoxide reductase subunit AhpC
MFLSHPYDFTPVCTTELAEASRLLPEFKARNVKIIALSCSPLEKHKEWIDDIKAYAGLSDFQIPIIDDSERVISIKLGMIRAEDIDKENTPVTVRYVRGLTWRLERECFD